MMSKTKWCPFCGSVDVDMDMRRNVHEIFSPPKFTYSVICGMCSAHGPDAPSSDIAIARWNERVEVDGNMERKLDAGAKR